MTDQEPYTVRITIWILGDQLLLEHPALAAAAATDATDVRVVLVESASRMARLPYHRKKLVLLLAAMRHYDRTVNITWVMAHYHAASKYLDSNGTTAEATGGSDWKKYMHPRTQRRIFFPQLWSAEEWQNWGIE